MPRAPKALKERRPGEELTLPQLELLCCGSSLFEEMPFRSEEEARRAWAENRDAVMSLRDVPPAERLLTHLFYRSGTRPFGYWQFDLERDVPRFQFVELARLGLIDAAERAKAIELARAQWKWWYAQYTAAWQAIASRVSDEQLLQFWPALPAVDRNGNVYDYEEEET